MQTHILRLLVVLSYLQYEFIYHMYGKENYNQITANLDLLLQRFNEVRHFQFSNYTCDWKDRKAAKLR